MMFTATRQFYKSDTQKTYKTEFSQLLVYANALHKCHRVSGYSLCWMLVTVHR